MSTDSVISIAWDILKCVVIPIKRQFGYALFSKRYAEDLQKEVGKLAYEDERIHNAVEEARNNLRNVYGQVTEWQASAEKALKEARDLLRDFEMAKKTCCHGTLPNPSCRYQFSRKAKDKIKIIELLAQDCSKFKDVSFSDPAPGSVATLSPTRKEGKDVVPSIKLRDDGIFESRALIIRDIMDALADNNNSAVGVYGMGGVGKSTLLADAEKRIREEKSFDLVAKADVSENPDIKRIQGEIAHALGLDIKNEEYVSVRAERLHKRLENEEKKEKKVLIILDNLWKGLDLKSVGIPCGHDNKVIGCKLLLTSRNRDVLRREMGCDKDFLLGGLHEEEAKELFERIVGDKVHVDEFKPLVDEALHKCAGVPFLILAIAKRFRDAGLAEWKDTLKQIEMFKDRGINEVINKMLQLSYDNLEEEVKLTLRLCVVYGVSEPSLENLVRYGVGLGLYGQDSSMEEARNRLSSLIRTLQASSLLLENGDGNGFKIHDLVREFVALAISGDHSLLVLKDKDKCIMELPKDKLKNCREICFPYVYLKELPEELDCPKLQIFLLFTNNKSLNVPNLLFKSMTKLMVLNLTGISVTCSPSPFQLLENLHTLCLDDCMLDNVAFIGELKGLQILSFQNSTIQRLPKEIGQLVELRLLDLNNCSQLQKIEPSVLGSLIKLEELYMENSFDKWNALEQTLPSNASLIELNNMKTLCTLHVSIPNPSVLPDDLNIEKLTKYKIQIGNAWCLPRAYRGSRTLELKFNPISDVLQKGCIQTTLSGTDNLFLDELNGIEQSICELSQEGFPKLKHLHIVNSPSIHYILRWPSLTSFKKLESLLLKNLINLEKICHNHMSFKSFSTLKVVQVESCDKMEVLFPLSLLRELPQLEEIRVLDCHLMREIVEDDDCDKVDLRNLHVLELRNLPYISNFLIAMTAPSSSTSIDQVGTQIAFFDGQQVSTPSLESLMMIGLPKMKYLWGDKFPLRLSNLRSLVVSECNYLSKVINSVSLINLHKLNTLTIKNCVLVQEIFYLDGSSASGNVETLSELTIIKLGFLPSLRNIWNKNPCGIVRFHNLKQLSVYGCGNLPFMFFPSMVKSLANLRVLIVWNCKKMERIIMEEEGSGMGTSEILVFPMLTKLHLKNLESFSCFSCEEGSQDIQSQDHIISRFSALFNRQVSIPSLESLTMNELPKVKYLWSDEFPLGLSNLQSLAILDCRSLSKIINSVSLVKLHKLHTLTIKNCISVQEIFYLDRPSIGGNVETLSELTTMELKRLPSLMHIWNKNPCGIVWFHKLMELEVSNCDNLRFMFFPSMVKSLVKLRVLRVRDCKKMDSIIIEEEGSQMKTLEILAFPMLTNLYLDKLESFSCFSCRKWSQGVWSQDHVKSCFTSLFNQEVAFPNLEKLEIFSMGNIEMIWDNQVYFRHLKTLDVSFCDGLSYIFTPTIAGNLEELTELTITYCKMLTEVIIDEGGEEGHVVAFKQLTFMELEGLTRLRCFNSGGYTLVFPLLENVIVNGCLNMKFFSDGLIEAPKLDKVQVTKHKMWFWKGNLNITIQNMFEEMATITRLRKMRLSEFPKLIGKWHSELNPIKSSWRLESLMVDKCPSFTNAISSRLMLILNNMHTLHVRDCELLEEIFDLEGLEGVERTQLLPSRSVTLELVNLPKLSRLWNKDLQEVLPYNFLINLTLYKCSNLRHAFSPCMAWFLGNLEKMEIEECGKMEGVIAEEEGQESIWEIIQFSSLRWMKLKCLPNLTSFLSGKNPMLICPQLEDLSIAHCPKIRSLAWQSLMEIDNGTPSLFTPQVQFPFLMSMALSHMDNIRKIWTDNPPETLTCETLREVQVQNSTSLDELHKLLVESCGIEEIVAGGDDTPHSTAAQVLFPKLTSLVLHDMPQLKNFCPNYPTLNWPSLQESQVTHCDRLNMSSFAAPMNKWTWRDHEQDLLDREEHCSFERDFPNLERLLLVNKDIQMIQDGKFPDDIFGKPKALTLACFHDEKVVFPPKFVLERFQNLKSLEVFCSSFEEIFPNEGFVDKGRHPGLENLRELKLSKLHNLKRVWREDYLVVKILQSIETFEFQDCPGLTTLFPAVTDFQNLTKLVVKNCSGLVHLVTFSAVTNLVHLTDMTIIGCERMNDVVANDGNGEGKVISFGKLERLTLLFLQSLVCFSSTTGCIFRFPSLYRIEVEECPKMKIFSKGMLNTPELHYASLFRCAWDVRLEGDLNMAIQKLSA